MMLEDEEESSKEAPALEEEILGDSPTQPAVETMPSYSKPELVKESCPKLSFCIMSGPRPRPMVHCSWYCGFMEGDPIAEDEVLWTEAPDSEDVDSCGGITSREFEWAGEAAGLYV